MSAERFAEALAVEALAYDIYGLQKLDRLDIKRTEASQRLADLYLFISPYQRETLRNACQQAFIDGVSTVLGVVDGSSQLNGVFEDFSLLHDATGVMLKIGSADSFSRGHRGLSSSASS